MMDQNTKDLLSLLIPSIGTVLAALIPALTDLIKVRWQAVRSNTQSDMRLSDSAALEPPTAPRSFPELQRKSMIMSGLAGLVLSLGVVFTLRTFSNNEPTPAPPPSPEITVQRLNIGFSSEEDLPGPEVAIPVSWSTHTIGTTEFIRDHDWHLWLFICKQGEQLCAIKKLNVQVSGRWDQFVHIGKRSPEDDCQEFEVGFVVVNGEMNHDLTTIVTNAAEPTAKRDEHSEVARWFHVIRNCQAISS
jgi:hypothetical protein